VPSGRRYHITGTQALVDSQMLHHALLFACTGDMKEQEGADAGRLADRTPVPYACTCLTCFTNDSARLTVCTYYSSASLPAQTESLVSRPI
jgi:hypothetical protein